jgi:phosphohistidine phosphatase
MQITVMRHGIAHDREAPDCPPDPERRLTELGIKRTRQAASGLKQLVPDIDRCITSPYLRATETLALAVEGLDLRHIPVEESETLIPMADPSDVLAVLRERRAQSVLLVGHAPHLDRFLTLMLTGQDGEQTWLKKAGAALLEVEAALEPGDALVRWIVPPKALRALA